MKHKQIWIAAFGLYGALMLWLLFDRPGYVEGIPYWDQAANNLNLVPFRTLVLFSRLLDSSHPEYVQAAVVNLFGNVIMFIPLGSLLPLVYARLDRYWKVLLTTTLIITAVEIIQLLTLVGSCDIDDLILNLLGASMGYGLYRILRK